VDSLVSVCRKMYCFSILNRELALCNRKSWKMYLAGWNEINEAAPSVRQLRLDNTYDTTCDTPTGIARLFAFLVSALSQIVNFLMDD
jgi:hypothetical protein